MIQHGAQNILQAKGEAASGMTLSALDIDDVIAKGERKTNELKAKLKEAGLDVLQSFSLDGGAASSVYEWEGEDYREKHGYVSLLFPTSLF